MQIQQVYVHWLGEVFHINPIKAVCSIVAGHIIDFNGWMMRVGTESVFVAE